MCLTLVTDGHLTGISCSIGVCIECCQTRFKRSRRRRNWKRHARPNEGFKLKFYVCIMKLCTLAHPLEENLKWICLTLNLLGDPLWPVGTIWTSTLLSLLNGWKKERVEKSQNHTQIVVLINESDKQWCHWIRLYKCSALSLYLGMTKIFTVRDCQSLTTFCPQVRRSRLTSDSSGSLGAMLHWNDKKKNHFYFNLHLNQMALNDSGAHTAHKFLAKSTD